MDTSILDKMFPNSPSDEHLELCDKIIFALRSSGREYEPEAWEEAATLALLEDYKDWANHFIKIAGFIRNRNLKKGGIP